MPLYCRQTDKLEQNMAVNPEGNRVEAQGGEAAPWQHHGPALRCAARVPAIPRRVSRRAAAAEGDTRAHGGAVEETWKTATGGSLARVRDAGTSIDTGVDGKWNTVHPGRYLIYRPASRLA